MQKAMTKEDKETFNKWFNVEGPNPITGQDITRFIDNNYKSEYHAELAKIVNNSK